MFILTDNNEVYTYSGKKLEYWSNGYPVIDGMAFSCDNHTVHEIDSIPDEVDILKYCYNEKTGFYINTDWVAPIKPSNQYGVPDDIFDLIIDDYTMSLIEEGVIG